MIDRSLNYGRYHVERFLRASGDFRRVLDLGAGLGQDLELSRTVNPAAALHAIEASPEYADALCARGICVHRLNLENERLPFSDGAIDIVIANQLLEHVKEIFWIMHEISRVLTRGGKLIIGVPNLAALHNRVLLCFGRQPSPIKTSSAHVRGFTRSDMLRFLEECFPGGYRLRAFGGSNFYPFPPVLARPLASLFPGMAWGIFFLLEKHKDYRKSFLECPIAQRLETNLFVGHS